MRNSRPNSPARVTKDYALGVWNVVELAFDDDSQAPQVEKNVRTVLPMHVYRLCISHHSKTRDRQRKLCVDNFLTIATLGHLTVPPSSSVSVGGGDLAAS